MSIDFPNHQYAIQLMRDGEPIETDFEETLEDAYENAKFTELHSGRYDVRIVDRNQQVIAHFCEPYEGRRVDTVKTDWLERIRLDYGIDKDVFKKAVEHWLEHDQSDE